MKIEFYIKETGISIPEETCRDLYFVMNNEVYVDNSETYESQAASIGFEDCIVKSETVGWRVVK